MSVYHNDEYLVNLKYKKISPIMLPIKSLLPSQTEELSVFDEDTNLRSMIFNLWYLKNDMVQS